MIVQAKIQKSIQFRFLLVNKYFTFNAKNKESKTHFDYEKTHKHINHSPSMLPSTRRVFIPKVF